MGYTTITQHSTPKWGYFCKNETVTVNKCGETVGGYLALDCFCRTWKEETSQRCQGQTRLISLQWPLKFLPWDINEVIHRKAAARHKPAPAPLRFPFPNPPAALRLYIGRAAVCQAGSLYHSPPRAWQLRSMAEAVGACAEGRGCSCACVTVPGEGDNSLALCPTLTQK